MSNQDYNIGIVGLGTMGANLALNIADHGYRVIGYNRHGERVEAFRQAAEDASLAERTGATTDLAEFTAALSAPRTVLLMVPAGEPVEQMIEALRPHLGHQDIIIDGGNSHYTDTARRLRELSREDKCIHYLGMGISGGEEGARHGPSMMPGGSKAAWEESGPILRAAAAKVGDDPCVTWLGRDGAGHYVKMVHNGIEYAVMELIAESYDLMSRLLGLDDAALGRVYAQWNATELRGFLMEISADIFDQREPGDDRPLVDLILDVAHQKGTGAWTSQDAMDLEVAVPTIDAAVGMRALSVDRRRRGELSQRLPDPAPDQDAAPGDHEQFIEQLRQALYTAMLLSYAQGLHLLHAADEHHGFGLKLEDVARIWRGGCIIRADLLEDLRALYQAEPKRVHPLDDEDFAQRVADGLPALREVARRGAERGIPLPGLMSALAYLDAYRSAHLPANLIQAQRDYFGAHGIERVDREGQFHGHWRRAAGD